MNILINKYEHKKLDKKYDIAESSYEGAVSEHYLARSRANMYKVGYPRLLQQMGYGA